MHRARRPGRMRGGGGAGNGCGGDAGLIPVIGSHIASVKYISNMSHIFYR